VIFSRFALLAVAVACANPAPDPAPPATEHWVLTPDSVRLFYRGVGGGPETVIVPLAQRRGC
jgi:hypothetical protein